MRDKAKEGKAFLEEHDETQESGEEVIKMMTEEKDLGDLFGNSGDESEFFLDESFYSIRKKYGVGYFKPKDLHNLDISKYKIGEEFGEDGMWKKIIPKKISSSELNHIKNLLNDFNNNRGRDIRIPKAPVDKIIDKIKDLYIIAEDILSGRGYCIGTKEGLVLARYSYEQNYFDIKNSFLKTKIESLKESEFSDDLSRLYPNFENSEEKEKIKKVLEEIKDIEYGFISKVDGSRIADRDWIHDCPNLGTYYEVAKDPEETLKNKLGICQDQSLAIKYLFNKYYPDITCTLYAMTTGRFGHCVPCFCDCGKFYYLENAWDKEKGLHGSFDSEEELKKYLEMIYHKHHDKDTNNAPVIVKTYDDYLKERYSLNESYIELK